MIDPKAFTETLIDNEVSLISGVPDSLMEGFCTYLEDEVKGLRHIVAPNEGSAVSIAAGSYMSSGKIPVVYMQNSGLGNSINPLVSLASRDVYGIPMLLLIGWRGEPGVADEPQHLTQGAITREILDILGLSWFVLSDSLSEAKVQVERGLKEARENKTQVCALVTKGTFQQSPKTQDQLSVKKIETKAAIEIVLRELQPHVVVASTGFNSRVLYEIRKETGQDSSLDFLNVGAMGHASQIALGIASVAKEYKTLCLDGDGSALMHFGGLASITHSSVKNLHIALLNNSVHASVGGQRTAGSRVSFSGVAKEIGFEHVAKAQVGREIENFYAGLKNLHGTSFLEVETWTDHSRTLPRPEETPFERIRDFMAKSKAKKGA